ncbi:hypothetical protein BC826DRAFT_1031894 [Russula brevipes]|nr:hypothetical protein BC826DRAFT_1031894 [Russula brevipes]
MAVIQPSINEIDKRISDSRDILSSLPRPHPHRSAWLFALADALSWRYFLSDDERDLDTAILQFTLAIFLPSRLSTECAQISLPLLRRSIKLKQSSSVRHCIKYLHYLRDRSLEAFDLAYNDVTALLVHALGFRLWLEPGYALRDVEEMSVLCHDLLASDVWGPTLNRAIENLTRAVIHVIDISNQPSLQVIECLREAHAHRPDFHAVSYALSWSLFSRFCVTRTNEDYEDAMTTLDKIIASHTPTDSPGEFVSAAFSLATMLAHGRFIFRGNPEDLEEAIFRSRSALNTVPLEDPERFTFVQSLEGLKRRRLDVFGVTGGLAEARSGDSDIANLPSFSTLATSLAKSNTVKHTSAMAEDRDQHLRALESIDHITDAADINEAIGFCRQLLLMAHLTAAKLGTLLHREFCRTDDIRYLDEAIAVRRGILKPPSGQYAQLDITRQLISALFVRLELLEMMHLFSMAVGNTYATVPDRFEVSCLWAPVARAFEHTSVSTAYENAISLMQESLTFSPTLEIQHSRLVSMRHHYETLPLGQASYQVHTGQLKQAIETLERGRGLLWSEMRGLRTSLDQLRVDLDALTTSATSAAWMTHDEIDGDEVMDPFGRLVMKQRNLLDERDGLVAQIQTLPGFEGFLMTPSFEGLSSAAMRGPVIIINHCDLKDQLWAARKEGMDSGEYEAALSSVLDGLYDLVGRPVIQRLHELKIPEQSRVWWCPTSVFCSLPLHAMGPVRSDGHAFILLVAQPDAKMPMALQEMRIVQALGPSVTTLIWETPTPTAALQHLKDHQFAHISCHGMLETGKPFDASFKLYEGTRLTLLDIVRSRLPTCHTAEVTEESIADEGLHLAAAVQYCGFRSVVGTMWAMADVDGPDLARHFYRSVFSDRWQGTPYYERTAEALRDAVRRLRGKRKITLERWVNFVHYGA